jgi:glycosyltransferase involved in cell wall biosynthesis
MGRSIPLRVVGNGSENFRDRWEALGPGMIEVGGWVPDLEREFAAARVFLAPLRYGAGTKGKILRALAHGIPIVTTTVGAEGNHGVVGDGLSVADRVDDMAELVARLVSDDVAFQEARQRAIRASHAAWRHQQAVDVEFAAWLRRRIASRDGHDPTRVPGVTNQVAHWIVGPSTARDARG